MSQIEGQTNQLTAPDQRVPVAISPSGEFVIDSISSLYRVGAFYHAAGINPTCTKVEHYMVLIQASRDLRVPLMQALLNIAIIDNKPVMHSKLPMALVLRTKEMEQYTQDVVERNPDGSIGPQTRGIVVVQRKGLSPISGVFSMADAKQAELLSKRNWRNYPADMLLNRARARALSTTFPDALLGMGIDTDGDFFDGDRPRHVRNDAPPPPSRAASLIDSIPDVGAAGSAGRATPAPAAPSFDVDEIAQAMDAQA